MRGNQLKSGENKQFCLESVIKFGSFKTALVDQSTK